MIIGLGQFGLDVAALLLPRLALLRQTYNPSALPHAQVGLVARQGDDRVCLVAEHPTGLLANVTAVQHFVVRETSASARAAYEGALQRLLGQKWYPLEDKVLTRDSSWLKRLILPALADHPDRPLGIARLQLYLLVARDESILSVEQIVSLLRSIEAVVEAPLVTTLIVQSNADGRVQNGRDLLCELERTLLGRSVGDPLIHQIYLLSDTKEDFSRSAEQGERALVACNFLEGALTSELSNQLLEYSSTPEPGTLRIGTLSAAKLYNPLAEILAEYFYKETSRRLGKRYLADPGERALAAARAAGANSLSLMSIGRRAVAGLPVQVKPRSRPWDPALRKLAAFWPSRLSSEEAILHEVLLDEVPRLEVDRARWYSHLRPISPPPEPAGFDETIDQWWRELLRFRATILGGTGAVGETSPPEGAATFESWTDNVGVNLGSSPRRTPPAGISNEATINFDGDSSQARKESYGWLQETIAHKKGEIATVVATEPGGLYLAAAHLEGYRSKRDKILAALPAWRRQREHDAAIGPPDYDERVLHRRKHSLVEAQAARPYPSALIARLFLTWFLSFYIYLRGLIAGVWPVLSDTMIATYGTAGVLIPIGLGWSLVVLLDIRLWREKRRESLQARPYLSTLLIRLLLLLLLLLVMLTVGDKWGPSWWLLFLKQNDRPITLAVVWTTPFILLYIVLYGVSSLRVLLSQRRIEDMVLKEVDKRLERAFYGAHEAGQQQETRTGLMDQALSLHDEYLLNRLQDGVTGAAVESQSLYDTVNGTIEALSAEIAAEPPPLLRSTVYYPLAEGRVRAEVKELVGDGPDDTSASRSIPVSSVLSALGSQKALAAILRQDIQTALYKRVQNLQSRELSLSTLMAQEVRLVPTYPYRFDELRTRSKLLWPILPQLHRSALKREKMEFLLLPDLPDITIRDIEGREAAVRPLASCDYHGVHYIKVISGLPNSLCADGPSEGRGD